MDSGWKQREKRLRNEITGLISRENFSGFSDEETKKFNKYLELMKEAEKSTKVETKKIRESFDEAVTGGIQASSNELSNFVEQLSKDIKAKGLQKTIKGFIDLAANIGMAVSALNMLADIPDIFSNDELTSGEKFLQLLQNITTITTSAALLGPSLVDLKNIASGLFNFANAGKTAGEAAGEVVGEATKQAAKQATKQGGQTAATGGITAILPALVSALPIILGVGAGLAAIGVGIYAAIKAYNKEADALKDAQKAQEQLTKTVKETSDAYNQIKSDINSYKEAQTNLNELTKGTQEWREALVQANSEVLSLLEKYSELSKYISNENGVLIIDDEGLTLIQQDSLNKNILAQNAQIYGQQRVAKAQEEYNAKELARTIVEKTGVDTDNIDGVKNAILQLENNISTEGIADISELTSTLIDNLTEEHWYLGARFEDYYENLSNALLENIGSLEQLKITMEANNELLMQQNALAYSNSLKLKGYGVTEQSVYGGMLARTSLEDEAAIENLTESLRKKRGNNQDLIQQYYRDVFDVELTDSEIKGTGGGNFEVLGEDGEWETVSYDTLARNYAQFIIQEQKLQTALPSFINEYKEIVKNIEDTDILDAVNTIISTNKALSDSSLLNLRDGDINKIKEALSNTDYQKYVEDLDSLWKAEYYDALDNITEANGIYYNQVDLATIGRFSNKEVVFATKANLG